MAVLQFSFFFIFPPLSFFRGFLQSMWFCLFANGIYFHFHKFVTLFSLSEWSAYCQADALRSVDSLIQVSAWSSCVSGFGLASLCSDCMVCGLFTLHAEAHTSRIMPNFAEVQRDSKRWAQFHTSIFPELYMVCE